MSRGELAFVLCGALGGLVVWGCTVQAEIRTSPPDVKVRTIARVADSDISEVVTRHAVCYVARYAYYGVSISCVPINELPAEKKP